MDNISEIGLWIAKIHQISDRLMEAKLKNNNLEGFSAAQGRVLFILNEISNEKLLEIPIQALVNELNLSNSSFTQLLDALQKTELIRRVPSTIDRRMTHIQKDEPKFSEYLGVYSKILMEMTEAYYRNLSNKEVTLVEQVLPKILDSLMKEESS